MAKKEKKAKKEKPAKPAKKKKKKSDADGGGMKEFFANHIEKMLFVVVAGICFMLVWSGFQSRTVFDDPSRNPSELDQQITVTSNKVRDYTWENDYRDERTDDQQYPQRAEQARQRLAVDSYQPNQQLRPPVSPPRVRRKDPELLAAVDLQVRAGYGRKSNQVLGRGPERGPNQESQDVDPGEMFEQEEQYDQDDPNVEPLPGNTRVTGEGRNNRSRGEDAEGVYFCSVTGLVPFREQLRLYQDALLNSRGRDPMRDVPTYINWGLERAEQDARGNVGTYKPIAYGTQVNEAGGNRRGGVEGRARAFMSDGEGGDDFHDDFRHSMLTSAIPNVETLDAKRLFVHDRVHVLTEEAYAKEVAQLSEDQAEVADQGEVDIFTSAANTGIDGIPGRPRGERYGEGEYSRGEGRGERRGGQGLEGRNRGIEFRGDMPLEEAPEYLMFRYVDLDVIPGRTYRYRLVLLLDDPNNSNFGAPSYDALEGSVAQRLSDPEEKKSHARKTAASEPSNPVRVLAGQNMLMGQVEPVAKSVIRDTGMIYSRPGAEVTAKVVALKFDAERALDIPSEETVRPGSTIGFKKEVWVPIWDQGVMVKEEQEFKFDSVVLDIRGGAKQSTEALSQPGELLVWDESGRVRILSEKDDPDEYARNVLKPEKRRRGRDGEGEGEGGRRGAEGRGGEGGRGEGGGEGARRGRSSARRGGAG